MRHLPCRAHTARVPNRREFEDEGQQQQGAAVLQDALLHALQQLFGFIGGAVPFEILHFNESFGVVKVSSR